MTVCTTCLNKKQIRVFATDADKRNHYLNIAAGAATGGYLYLNPVRYNLIPCPMCGGEE